VADSAVLAGLGIDAERNEALPDDVLAVVSAPAERAMLSRLAVTRTDVAWDRLLFSAKESVYKALHPATGLWLGFEDVTVAFAPDTYSFTAALERPVQLAGRQLTELDGRWTAQRGIVATAIAVPATASQPRFGAT
jgi:4'-phosphopantetheinyl transferase EntD